MNVLIGLIMFMVIITLHELGHFIGAKASNIKVNEFSIGMGPAVLKKQKGETQYSLRALPIGGYVSMEGEDEESSDKRSFGNASPLARFITIFAGPFMNFVLAFVILLFVIGNRGVAKPVIGSFSENSPAQKAGMQVNDRIVKIDDEKINTFMDASRLISSSKGKELLVTYERNGVENTVKIKPVEMEGAYIIGFAPYISKSFSDVIAGAFNTCVYFTRLIWDSLKGLISGAFGLKDLSGPIGIIGNMGAYIEGGVYSLLNFAALISVNLGFFNLLPIPALDGSKLLFIIIEAIRRKPLNKKFEGYITAAGFILLLGLMLIVSIKDIFSFIS
ncbi:RIP metalloprotease RseP [Peptoniphilaceae bacterium SGI.131]